MHLAYMCVCVCVLDREDSRVFASSTSSRAFLADDCASDLLQ